MRASATGGDGCIPNRSSRRRPIDSWITSSIVPSPVRRTHPQPEFVLSIRWSDDAAGPCVESPDRTVRLVMRRRSVCSRLLCRFLLLSVWVHPLLVSDHRNDEEHQDDEGYEVLEVEHLGASSGDDV